MHPSRRVQQRLGLQVLFDFDDIIDAIGFAAAHGFGVLELNLGNLHFSQQLARKRERGRIRKAAKLVGVKLAVHAVGGPSFFEPSPRVSRCAVAELEWVLGQADEAGIVNVVMHLGFEMYYGMAEGSAFPHERFPEFYAELVGNALADLKEHARGKARLCVENVGGFRFPFVHDILERLLGGNLGLCLDVGHVNILSEGTRRKEVAFFKRHRRRVFHAHLHDNHGEHDEHLALGLGNIDFRRWFRFLADTPALMAFEVRPREQALASLDYFKRKVEPGL